MLERYLVRYFLAVVDQGTFSRAASHCHVSQPTLSIGIAKLEKIVDLQLFVRSAQRVELTESGARFLIHARRIEREFNAVLQSMSGSGSPQGSLRMGVLASVPGEIVASAIAAARPSEDYRFELVFGNERELVAHLAKGRIDIALTLVNRGGDRFFETPVLTEGYSAAIPANHPLATKPELAAEELAQEAMIVRRHCEALSDTSRFFTERGIRPHLALRSTNDERVLQMVASGLGITVMPDCYTAAGIRRPRLSGFLLQRTIGWAATLEAEHHINTPLPLVARISEALQDTAR